MPPSFSRPDKLSDAMTVLYEIDMLRFAANRLLHGKWESEKDGWAYLECFLLHFRNLIEFLGKDESKLREGTLHISSIWHRLRVPEPARMSAIREQGSRLYEKYERADDRISVYLQHCTELRTVSKTWIVGMMNEEIEAILPDVEKALRVGRQPWTEERPATSLGVASYGTATVTTFAAAGESFPLPAPEKQKP
jgi:hypothetical protein